MRGVLFAASPRLIDADTREQAAREQAFDEPADAASFSATQANKPTSQQANRATGQQGNKATRQQGNKATGQQGNRATSQRELRANKKPCTPIPSPPQARTGSRLRSLRGVRRCLEAEGRRTAAPPSTAERRRTARSLPTTFSLPPRRRGRVADFGRRGGRGLWEGCGFSAGPSIDKGRARRCVGPTALQAPPDPPFAARGRLPVLACKGEGMGVQGTLNAWSSLHRFATTH